MIRRTTGAALALSFCLAVLPGCPGAAAPGPAPTSASTSTPAGPVEVCDKLKSLGCPEGLREECAASVAHILQADLIDLDRDCIMIARDQQEAALCAGIKCRGAP